MSEDKDVVEVMARAIWGKRPDCVGKPWPLETEAQRRAYPHNPICAVDLCFDYARAALAVLEQADYRVVKKAPGITHEQEPFRGEWVTLNP